MGNGMNIQNDVLHVAFCRSTDPRNGDLTCGQLGRWLYDLSIDFVVSQFFCKRRNERLLCQIDQSALLRSFPGFLFVRVPYISGVQNGRIVGQGQDTCTKRSRVS